MRYYCKARLNGVEVGRGIAQNKKAAKNMAAQTVLNNICPSLYTEWKDQLKNYANALDESVNGKNDTT